MIKRKDLDKIFLDCLFKKGESQEGAIIVEGVLSKFGFNPKRLNSHSDEIYGMLMQLPNEFRASIGGGSALSKMEFEDSNGRKVNDLVSAEQLVSLGMALGYMRCQVPREEWNSVSPYYVFYDRMVVN